MQRPDMFLAVLRVAVVVRVAGGMGICAMHAGRLGMHSLLRRLLAFLHLHSHGLYLSSLPGGVPR